jgi:hypothetical protein
MGPAFGRPDDSSASADPGPIRCGGSCLGEVVDGLV